MGARGPIGKRSTAKAGHRTKAELDDIETVDATGGEVTMPEPSPLWDPIARDWYCSLAESGQARFMEPSDWHAARFVAEAMTRNLENEKFSAMLFTGVWSAMNDLLTTEGARRRVKLEVQRATNSSESTPAGVTALDDYRSTITG